MSDIIREPLTETEVATIVQAEIARSLDYEMSELRKDRVRALEYSRGVMNDLPAQEGRSNATTKEVGDIINFCMPGLMRVFTQNQDIVTYEPVGPEDIENAKQATEYVNYLLRKDINAYEVFNDVFNDALLFGNGIVKHWWEPFDKVTFEGPYTNLDENSLTLLLSDPEIEVVEQNSREIEIQPPTPENPFGGPLPVMPPMVTTVYDVKLKRTVKDGRLKVVAIPPEEFLIDSRATALRTATFCGHRSYVTRSSLIEQGYDPVIVDGLPTFSGELSYDGLLTTRREYAGATYNPSSVDRSMEMVEVIECYLKCDANGDGIAETLKIIVGGMGTGDILDIEEWEDEFPFTDFVANRVPHRWLGRSIFNEVEDAQKIKTTVWRGLIDNLIATNVPDRLVDINRVLNEDAIYDRNLGNVILTKGDPNSVVSHTTIPFTADKSIIAMNMVDDMIETRTGISKNTMALDMNALQGQTATAINAAQSGAYAKVELIARNFAEMGFKNFFRAILKLIVQNQDKERIIELRNEFVPIDPRGWKADMDCSVSVGLGSGSKDKDIAFYTAIANEQKQIIQFAGPDNPICGIPEYSNTLRKLVEASGHKDASQFFKEINPQQLAAQQQQPKQDPKQAEAMAKLQFQQQEAAAKLELEKQEAAARIQLEQQKAQAEFQLQSQKNQMEIEFMKQKNMIELQHKREIAQINAQLKREEMQNEMALTEQSNLIHGITKSGAQDDNLRNRTVPEEGI